MGKFKLDDFVYYDGHLCQIVGDAKNFWGDIKYIVQGCEEKYNKFSTAFEEELASTYICEPKKQVHKFNLNEWKCTIINGEIVLEKL